MGTFLNQRRLRDYPRLFFFTMWVLFSLNWIFHKGWLGAVGQLIGNDFLAFYSGGLLMRTMPSMLYDLDQQMALQHALIAPTEISGFVPFINPPYTAMFFSVFTYLPYIWALLVWMVLSLVCLTLAAGLVAKKILPKNLQVTNLSSWQIFFLAGSFFPFLVGMEVGQNHAITLLIYTSVIALILSKKDLQAGLIAGFLIYKPQFVLGFLLIWLAQKHWKSLAGFGLVAISFIGASLLWRGFQPFTAYLDVTSLFLQAMGLKDMGSHFGITLYGILLGFFGISNWRTLSTINNILMLGVMACIGIYAFRLKNKPVDKQIPALLLAVLLPLFITPHVLMYDAVILIPLFALWARWQPDTRLIKVSIFVYLAFFILPFAAYQINFPILAFILMGVIILLIQAIILPNRHTISRTT